MCCDNLCPHMHTYKPSSDFNSILKLGELQCYHLPKSFVKNGGVVGEMQTSEPQKAGRSGLVDSAVHVEQLGDWSCHTVVFSPFARGDQSRGRGEGAVVKAAGGWNGNTQGA